ncbi:MAG: hypothetical protein RL190_98 [Actinomycetota bacterium]
MAVAVPRTAPAPPRRRSRPASAPRPRPAPQRRRRVQTRAGVGGRLAPFRLAFAALIVGVALSAIVYLHVQSLRATMQAGELRTQIAATMNDADNIQAETEQRLADGRVERAAAAYGMVLVPSEAMRTLPVRVPRDAETR